ncbi:MAG: integral rane sensor signal transduction histidine kinase, partial [Candidatus Solibacter sp.]|nr:integral rane sensor signal transduction histidine kinase [Candidatus Solibacter sp.]
MRLLPKDQDWTAYVYLVYLLYFLFYPFLVGAPAWQRYATLAGTAVSLALYFGSYWLRGVKVLWIVAAWFLMAIVFGRINPGSSVFFVYGACLYGKIWEPPTAFRFLAGHLAAVAVICWLLHLPVYSWLSSLVFSGLVGAVVIQYAQRQRLADRLAEAREQTEHLAKVAERERIARDLHDLLGHTLSLIVLKSELASRLSATQPERAAVEIRDVERISRDALAQVRAAVRGYRSMGFESELKQARATLETAGIAVEASVEAPRLSAMQESVFAL